VSEAGAVALSPILAYVVLRIRGMAPVNLPDSSMHTIYIVEPREMFIAIRPLWILRRDCEKEPRWILVVARLFDLGFGAVGASSQPATCLL